VGGGETDSTQSPDIEMVMMAGNGDADDVEVPETCAHVLGWSTLRVLPGPGGAGLMAAADMDGSPPSRNLQITSGYVGI
jgi:hypothetical protein